MNPYIMQGIGEGFEQATATLLAVSQKKQQLEKDNKEFDIGMKMKKLQLEALQEKMSPEQLDYNKTLQGLEIKQQKIKTESATLELNKTRREAELFQNESQKYLEGAKQGEADGRREGFEFAGQQYDLGLSPAGGVSYKQRTPTKELSREKATEELQKRAGARQPLDTKIPQPTKGGWFGIGATKVNEATTNFAKTVKTRQDLINMIKNSGALEEQGVNISELEDLYEDELLKLATEGYLSEK